MPEAISKSLCSLSALGPCGAYANAFQDVSSEWVYTGDDTLPMVRQDLDPDKYAEFAARWIDTGAGVVGGCCEVGPLHIAALRNLIDRYRA
jgi:S-methylmethionine-dependent homocysteine/selenocysteine methylase